MFVLPDAAVVASSIELLVTKSGAGEGGRRVKTAKADRAHLPATKGRIKALSKERHERELRTVGTCLRWLCLMQLLQVPVTPRWGIVHYMWIYALWCLSSGSGGSRNDARREGTGPRPGRYRQLPHGGFGRCGRTHRLVVLSALRFRPGFLATAGGQRRKGLLRRHFGWAYDVGGGVSAQHRDRGDNHSRRFG